MGEENTDKRTKDTVSMMDYGFNMYSLKKLVSKNQDLGKIKINLGVNESARMISTNDITVLNNNQKDIRDVTYEILTKKINAPVVVGDVVGEIKVYEQGKYKYSVDLTIDKDIKKANIFKIFYRNIVDVLLGNII